MQGREPDNQKVFHVKKPVKNDDQTAIGCEKCDAWFHGSCVA